MVKNIDEDGTLFSFNIRYCPKCRKRTTHQKVRDFNREYYRCDDCLVREIKKTGIYVPPFKKKWVRNNRLLLLSGFSTGGRD